MARKTRFLAEGVPHHITQRGNCRQPVFSDESDRCLYLDLLQMNCRKYEVGIWGYCLMSNHVHLISVPSNPVGLSKALARVHGDYARYFNLRRRG